MEFILPAAEKTMALIAQSMGESVESLSPRWAAEAALDAVRTLCDDIGIPAGLSELGVPIEDIPMLVEGALKVTRPVENNPRKLAPDEAAAIYEAAF